MEPMKPKAKLNGYALFSALGIFILGLDFLAIILAMARIFYAPILIVYLISGSAALVFLTFKDRKNLSWKRTVPGVLVAAIISAAIVFFLHSAEPSVFSGRDQGSFSEAAIRLDQNHQLEFSTPASQAFFQIYGPGQALNFPGFNYAPDGNLITNFSLGYVAWLATFYSLFGLSGLLIANGVLFFLFALSFFALLKLTANGRSASLGIALVLTFFIFSWLIKLTLSENLALAFIWFGVFELAIFFHSPSRLSFLSALGAFLLLTFTRIEAWSIIGMLLAALIIARTRDKKIFDRIGWQGPLILSVVFIASYAGAIWVNRPFYVASAKGLLRSFRGADPGTLSVLPYLFKVFYYYGALVFLLIGGMGVIYFLSKKKYFLLLPFLLLLPLLSYLIHPGISLDHPWMLRRFAFAILPLAIFYTALIVDRLFVRKILIILPVAFLIASNLSFSWNLFTFSDNQGLLAQTQQLSQDFAPTDLVLVDRLASGDGWSMISGPLSSLYGRQAAYFFNPSDLEKIDVKSFSHVYLIIPDEDAGIYERAGLMTRLTPQKEYRLTRNYLYVPDLIHTGGMSWSLPIGTATTTKGKIYLLNE